MNNEQLTKTLGTIKNYVDSTTKPKRIAEKSGTSGTNGYIAMAKMVITSTYVNRPIEFKFIQRGKLTPCTVSVQFANSSSTDPGLSNLKYMGSDYGVFMHKTAASTWLLYAKKSEAYDAVTLTENNTAAQGVTITYPGTFITEKPTSTDDNPVVNASLGYTVGSSDTATKLATARNITLTGDVTGSVSFNGTSDVSITTVVSDNSHSHSNYVAKAGDTMTGGLTISKTGDGVTLLNLATERAWAFKQKGTGGSAALDLQASTDGKSFRIVDASGAKAASFTANTNGVSLSLDGSLTATGNAAISGATTSTGGFISGGTVRSDTALTDDLGTGAIPWRYAYLKQVTLAGEANKNYGSIRVETVGTTSTVGDARLVLGNNIASGTASNAKGQLFMYGTNTGYTLLSPGNNSTSNITLTLPSSAGTLARTADNVASADKLKTARNIALTGDVTGNANFDGSGNISITTAVGDDTHEHTHVKSRGRVTAESGTTYPATKGLSMSEGYSNGYSTSYGNVLTMYGSGVSQLYIGWSGTSGAHEKAYIRSKRDTDDAAYSGWAQIYTSAHPQPSVTGSSGSCTGNAATATKLATARTINGTSFDGSANITTANWGTTRKLNRTSVNGSADVSIPLDYITCGVSNDNTNNYHLILESGQCTGDYTDKSIVIMVCNHYNNNSFGIAKATLRTNNATDGGTASGELIWIVRSGFAANVLCYNIRNTAKDTYMDVFYKSSGTYNSATIYILGEGSRGNQSSQWTKNNTNATGTKAYTETAMKALRSYTSTLVSAVDAGVVNKATQDSAGQQINTTYIKGLSVSGKTITYTKGDGTTGTITTQDTNTTYSTGNASTAGLTKLYTSTGTATDGTMTQNAIKSALDGKAASSHNHSAENITSGTLSADRLAASGATAGSYGPSANATPAHSGTFSVPYITVDAKGRVTAASTKTITLPADNNTDTKVTNTLATTTKAYITGTTTNSTNTGTQVFDTDVYLTANAGELRASKLKAYQFISDNGCSAPGSSASAIGLGTYALGNQAFASGTQTAAGGNYSHAFGYGSNKLLSIMSDYTQSTTNDTLKTLWLSTKFCLAHSKYSFVCGGDNLALGEFMHIEGNNNYGYSKYGHIEGYNNYAANNPAIHIEGENNTASGSDTHVEGRANEATGSYSHVGGYENVGKSCQYVFGHYNTSYSGSSSANTSSYSSLIIGNGTSSATSNCFRVTNNGAVYGLAAYSATGADYAEYFEWQDGNINKEDRRGYFVTLDGEQIRIAKPGDYILGIVSANPAVIGNNDMQWQGHYLFDEFGSHIIEKKTIINEDGEEEEVELLAINPELDTEKEYVHRSERPEWDTVGMLGVLAVYDDGTCQVNGFCECNENGIATASESGYRVMKRVNDHIVKVLFR